MPTSCGWTGAELAQTLVSPSNPHLFTAVDRLILLLRVANDAREFSAPVFWKADDVNMMALNKTFCGIESKEGACVVGRSAFLNQEGTS